MIISRTPYRISLFGGGTDYPEWFRQHGGAVLGGTINKYCYISVRTLPPFFEHRHRIVYSKVETVNAVDEIEHPAVRAVLGEMPVDCGLEIHYDGDLPARSGLGSSSSFTVGLLNIMHAFKGRMVSPNDLATEAIRIEQEVIGENVGSQDQVWAALGGLQTISFDTDGGFSATPIIMSAERRRALGSHMLLFFTGLSRYASNIAGKLIENIKNRERHLIAMQALVEEGRTVLQNEQHDIGDIGRLLREAWRFKRDLAEGVTTSVVDQMYEAAMSAGALGGKLLGAGGGGFMLVFARPEHHAAVREQLKDLIEVSFELGSAGSKIVIYEPNGLENN